jgi:hypothetical protein
MPNSQYEISSREIEVSGSLTLGEVLQQAPGFSTFRRSSSLIANPTPQGVPECRVPNPNELYRNFRVGNVVTVANPALTGKHLTGARRGRAGREGRSG